MRILKKQLNSAKNFKLKNRKSQTDVMSPLIKLIITLGAGFLFAWAVFLVISKFS